MNNTINSDLIRGNIDTIILRALYSGDRYGYDIVKEIEQRSSGQYKLKQPTLYSCLKRLENQGFIESYWGAKSIGGRRKYYTLTDLGKELFVKNKTDWEYSRSLIDNLIVDKDEDETVFAEASLGQDERNAAMSENEISDDAVPGDTTYADSYMQQYEVASSNSDSESYPEGSSYQDLSEEVLSNNETVGGYPEDMIGKSYRDSAEIINNLFFNEKPGTNYTKKIAGEEYTPENIYIDEQLSSQNYFNDSFDSELEEDDEDDLYDEEPAIAPVSFEFSRKPDPADEEKEDYSSQFYSYKSDPNTIPDKNQEPSFPNSDEILKKFEERLSQKRLKEQEQIIEPEAEGKANTEKPAEVTQLNLNESYDSEIRIHRPLETESKENAEYLRKDQIRVRNFKKLADSVTSLGDDVKIRSYESDSGTEFNSKYYYYSNKLKLKQYAILFGIMLIEIILSYCIIEVALRGSLTTASRGDLALYIIAVLAALVFPFIAFFANWFNPNKRKRAGYSFKTNILFRAIITLQLLVVIYFANVLGGMPYLTSAQYYVSLILPMVMSLNFIIDGIIFNALYKSGSYAVK